MKKRIAALALFIFFACLSAARAEEFSPFDPAVIENVLKKVAEYMYITLDPAIPPPVVVVAESVTWEKFKEIAAGWWNEDVEWKNCNVFVPPDKILLRANSKIHNLAHELTHFIQYRHRYKDRAFAEKRELACYDQSEKEAWYVQNKFR